jgi:5-hydroxyisourate hydrolase
MKSISTHVLDITRGRPAHDLPITISRKDGDSFTTLKTGKTDSDGRLKDLVPDGELVSGTYRITFDTGAYFAAQNIDGFYPEATVVFTIKDANAHYHVPLLLSPFGYSTYRGS